MAKTFDNISEASATNYLFLFAQRTLALQNEPPTPPPLNALGLPCEAMLQLWGWLQKGKAAEEPASEPKTTAEEKTTEKKPAAESATGTAVAGIKAAVGEAAACSSRNLACSSAQAVAVAAEEAAGVKVTADKVAETKTAMDKGKTRRSEEVRQREEHGHTFKTFAEKIATLARTFTEYIIDHEDDAAQEKRWRTTMKAEVQGQREDMQRQREDMQSVRERFDDEHSRIHEKLDRLVKNFETKKR